MKHPLVLLVLLLFGVTALGQFPPPAGQPGTTAIQKDSTIFRFWANSCTVERGFINIVDTTKVYNNNNHASYGESGDATGIPDEFAVSLGDGGIATLTFPDFIANLPGPDFAIFENSFTDDFLELGFVEVSSDGFRFVRFPAVSLTQDTSQVATFGTIDATKIHNFAGKYRVFYGTPFDLEDIADSTGIDLSRIIHVRIIDAVGCIQDGFSTFDSQGNKVNDPWPTEFHSCGFDLDAVGVINTPQALPSFDDPFFVDIYPNPFHDKITLTTAVRELLVIRILDLQGRILMQKELTTPESSMDVAGLSSGIYLVRITDKSGLSVTRKMFKK